MALILRRRRPRHPSGRASIAAIAATGASHGEHRRRALQLAGGVALGLMLADPAQGYSPNRILEAVIGGGVALAAGADLALTEILAQVRSTAVDLMRAAVQVAGAPEEEPSEERLPAAA